MHKELYECVLSYAPELAHLYRSHQLVDYWPAWIGSFTGPWVYEDVDGSCKLCLVQEMWEPVDALTIPPKALPAAVRAVKLGFLLMQLGTTMKQVNAAVLKAAQIESLALDVGLQHKGSPSPTKEHDEAQ